MKPDADFDLTNDLSDLPEEDETMSPERYDRRRKLEFFNRIAELLGTKPDRRNIAFVQLIKQFSPQEKFEARYAPKYHQINLFFHPIGGFDLFSSTWDLTFEQSLEIWRSDFSEAMEAGKITDFRSKVFLTALLAEEA